MNYVICISVHRVRRDQYLASSGPTTKRQSLIHRQATNEAQAYDVGRTIDPVAVAGTARTRQQADPLVIADRLSRWRPLASNAARVSGSVLLVLGVGVLVEQTL
jgi:hypothetical protein